MISDEDKERVRKETDFVALVSETVPLKQRGGEFWHVVLSTMRKARHSRSIPQQAYGIVLAAVKAETFLIIFANEKIFPFPTPFVI